MAPTKPVVGTPEIREWSAQRDQEGHRDYELTWLVNTGDDTAGPASALNATGLAVIGSSWNFSGFNDTDQYALCLPKASARRHGNRTTRGRLWLVKQHFTTRPSVRCQDNNVENPLQEPPKISGGSRS